MKYIYSAMFEFEGGKVFARVPDLPGCVSSGRDLEDAVEQISDAAALWLVAAEDMGAEIRPATPQADIPHENGAVFSLLQLDTLAYRARTDTRSVRKNVSLPAWMAALADKRGLNCSQILQEGLLARLG